MIHADSKSLRLASINIEGDKHLSEAVAFLQDFRPDVVCFQELTEQKIKFFEDALGMKCLYLPMMKTNSVSQDYSSPVVIYGVGIFSRLPLIRSRFEYYFKGSEKMSLLTHGDEYTVWRGFVESVFLFDGQEFVVATTHFTRTPDGSTSDKQREDLKKLLEFFENTQELILCGDFNAPRGGEIFGKLAERYKDNIPAHYDSSLDPVLHKAGPLRLMVDVLFSTPHYQITEVKLTEGISDHKAITALISRA